jgi:hypothetical protein
MLGHGGQHRRLRAGKDLEIRGSGEVFGGPIGFSDPARCIPRRGGVMEAASRSRSWTDPELNPTPSCADEVRLLGDDVELLFGS